MNSKYMGNLMLEQTFIKDKKSQMSNKKYYNTSSS